MYSYNQRGSVYLPVNAVEIDEQKSILRINVIDADRYPVETHTQEYQLLRHSICTECKSVVTAYALGSLKDFVFASNHELFDEPWKNNSVWKLIQQTEAFAFIAPNGHDFELTREKRLVPKCRCIERELVLPEPKSELPDESCPQSPSDGEYPCNIYKCNKPDCPKDRMTRHDCWLTRNMEAINAKRGLGEVLIEAGGV